MTQIEECKELIKNVINKNKELTQQLKQSKEQASLNAMNGNDEINHLEELNDGYKLDIFNLENTIKEKENIIHQQEEDYEKLLSKNNDLSSTINAQAENIDNLMAEIKALQISNEGIDDMLENIKKLESEIEAKNNAYKRLLEEHKRCEDAFAKAAHMLHEKDLEIDKFKHPIILSSTDFEYNPTDITSMPVEKVDSSLISTYRLGKTTERVKDKFVAFVKEIYKNSSKDKDNDWILNNLYESANNVHIGEKDRDVIIKRLLQLKKDGKPILTIDKEGYSFSPLSKEQFIEYITEKLS